MRFYGVCTLSLLLLASPIQAQVYRCEINGEVIFSQTPCDENATEYELNYTRPDPGNAPQVEPQADEQGQKPQPSRTEREIDAQGRAIEQEEAMINDLQMRREVELRKLEEQLDNLNEAELSAGRAEAIRARMEAINTRYDSVIDQHQQSIDRFYDNIDRLQNAP